MIHHVFANRSNVGDWLSARGIQRLLAPLPVVEHLCDEPFVPATLAALAALEPGDCVVIGGGGLLMDYFAPFWEGLQALAPRLDYCIWGAGYCDIKAEPSHPPPELLREVVRGSRLVVVRDELSRGYLSPGDLPEPVPCPALVVVDPLPPGHGLLHVDNYTTAGAETYDAMDALCQAHAARTGRIYRQTNNRIRPGSEADMAHCLSLYARSDLVVSSALHGCVIAVAMGRPVLAVSGDRKIEGFMEAAGLGDWVIDAADLQRLPALIEALPGQPPVPEFVAQARARNAAVAAQVRRIAAEAASRAGCAS